MNHTVTIGLDQWRDAEREHGAPSRPPLTLELKGGARARLAAGREGYKVASILGPDGIPVSTWNDGTELWSAGDYVKVGVEP